MSSGREGDSVQLQHEHVVRGLVKRCAVDLPLTYLLMLRVTDSFGSRQSNINDLVLYSSAPCLRHGLLAWSSPTWTSSLGSETTGADVVFVAAGAISYIELLALHACGGRADVHFFETAQYIP